MARRAVIVAIVQYLVALALATLALLVAFLGLLAVGVVGVYVGRRPGRRWMAATALVTGATAGAAILMGWPEPWIIVPFLGLGAFVAYRLAAAGRWRLAGLVVLGAAIPWTTLAAARVADPEGFRGAFVGAPSIPSLLAGVIALGVASIAIARGDAPARQPHHLNGPGAPGSRRVGNLAATILRDRSLAGIDVTTTLAWLVGLAAALVAQALVERIGIPSPGPVAVAVVVFAIVSTEVGFLAIPRRQRPAVEALFWLRNHEQADFAAARGGRLPTSVKSASAWLAAHPDPADGGAARVDLLAWTGDLAAARTAVESLAEGSPLEQFTKRTQRAWLDWIDGDPIDLDALARAARAVGAPDSVERLRAEAVVAAIESQVAASEGRDWTPPLRAIRAGLAERADGALTRTYRPVLLRGNLFIGAAFAIGAALIPGIPA